MIVFNSFWIFVLLVVIHTDAIDDNAWEKFKNEYNRKYSEREDQQRKGIFEKNSQLIEDHNKQNHAFTLKINQFGDWTHEEFIKYIGQSYTLETPENQNYLDNSPTDEALLLNKINTAIDLREKGWVSEVKDQGEKSVSGWAFSMTGAIEGQIFKTQEKCPQQPVQSLSEQFLIDCYDQKNEVKVEFKNVLSFVKNRGIYTEKLYNLNVTCPEENYPIEVSVLFNDLTTKEASETKIKKELYGSENSVPATVDASHQSFQFYHTGIYNEQKCSTKSQIASQAVLIVGYNEMDSNAKHWLVKNSLGKTWGEEGYMKIAYGTCGIETQACTVSAKRSFCDCKVK
ncbi:procathepsin L-like isoform X2 [Planococcus citri]|uniref:procathepsin L-like isoform X2 n=1 Tax=Planococcus citri TaxID=170843 RepID=UPI0031F823CC